MHIKMNTGLSGPLYCLVPQQEVAFDASFPFGARELRRLLAAGACSFIGDQKDLDAWIAANPDPEPEAEADAADDEAGELTVDHAGTAPAAEKPAEEKSAEEKPAGEKPAAEAETRAAAKPAKK